MRPGASHEGGFRQRYLAEQRAQLSENTQGKVWSAGTTWSRFIQGLTSACSLMRRIHQRWTYVIFTFIKMRHKGGEFTQYAGNGDGKGFQSGFKYTGKLSEARTEAHSVMIFVRVTMVHFILVILHRSALCVLSSLVDRSETLGCVFQWLTITNPRLVL